MVCFLRVFIVFLFVDKTLWLNNLKTSEVMNAKTSPFVICGEVILYFLFYNLHTVPLKVNFRY